MSIVNSTASLEQAQPIVEELYIIIIIITDQFSAQLSSDFGDFLTVLYTRISLATA